MLISCQMEIPEESYINPTDSRTNLELSIDPPALIFYPNQISTSVGSTISLEIFALEVDSVGGSYIRVNYDKNKLSLTSVTLGEFFSSTIDPIFFYDNNSTLGVLDIYTSSVGESESASGSGTLAHLVFSSTALGSSIITFGIESELVDSDDYPIQLNGFGEGVIDAE